MSKTPADRLQRITLKRDGTNWTVTRERENNGESGTFRDLDEAWSFIMVLYDKNGHPLCIDPERSRRIREDLDFSESDGWPSDEEIWAKAEQIGKSCGGSGYSNAVSSCEEAAQRMADWLRDRMKDGGRSGHTSN